MNQVFTIVIQNVKILYVKISHEIDITKNFTINQIRSLRKKFDIAHEKLKNRFKIVDKQLVTIQFKLNNDIVKIKNDRLCKLHERITIISMKFF